MSSPSRDLRDPTALGETLLEFVLPERKMNRRSPSEVYDLCVHAMEAVEDYTGLNDVKTVTPAGAKH